MMDHPGGENGAREVSAFPCTCGELFQGTLEGEPCLVSCPIDIYSTAEILEDGGESPCETGRKTGLALEWIAARTGRSIAVRMKNPLPAGRGYGTSTADVGAALSAANRVFGLGLTPQDAAHAAVQIEPSDSTFFPGLALFDHRAGRFYELLGEPPPARLVILDRGGTIDSEVFNAHDWRSELGGMVTEHRHAYRQLQDGIAARDLTAIGQASTLSAVCHQAILFDPLVDLAVKLAKETGAAGVCRAHSGTIVGLIFPEDYDRVGITTYLSKHIPAQVHLREAGLVCGGARYLSFARTRGERLRSGAGLSCRS